MSQTSEQFVTNCITRIYRAPCSIHLLRQRDRDVAESVFIAAQRGWGKAHEYLVKLCNDAEAGKYAPKQEQEEMVKIGVDLLPNVEVSTDGHVTINWKLK